VNVSHEIAETEVTPLMFAAHEIRSHAHGLPIIKLLVDAGANIAAEDPVLKITALEYAVMSNNTPVVRYLLDKGANPNHLGGSPSRSTLRIAAEFAADPAIMRLLIEKGATEAPANFHTQPYSANTIQTNVGLLGNAAANPNTNIFTNKADIDPAWVDANVQYVNSLSDQDRQVLNAYTFQGDTLINSWIRGMFDRSKFATHLLDSPLLSPLFYYYRRNKGPLETIDRDTYLTDIRINYQRYLTDFIADLSRIIADAPKSKQTMKIYRGIKHPDYLLAELQRSPVLKCNDFQSCTIDSFVAVEFAAVRPGGPWGLVLEITIPPGVPCMYIQSISSFYHEYEVILPPGILLESQGPVVLKNIPHTELSDFGIPADTVRVQLLKAVAPAPAAAAP
jgi:hypothetical protein